MTDIPAGNYPPHVSGHSPTPEGQRRSRAASWRCNARFFVATTLAGMVSEELLRFLLEAAMLWLL
ncbi:hypothetical protein [Nocardia coubleae]|uniref:Uncharacterized protein n=1 Tax=Nocardia coubleae TaxID=356147 RepID=A0A846VZ96_9NOCA|nr:hypothetical protein [Nocardia coubleae]NKX86075.1 hypothetical protein [Nocardia coubleae]